MRCRAKSYSIIIFIFFTPPQESLWGQEGNFTQISVEMDTNHQLEKRIKASNIKYEYGTLKKWQILKYN